MTMTFAEFVALVARLRALQTRGHGRRIYLDCHDAQAVRQHEAAVDKAVADLLLGVKEDEQRRELARAADDGNRLAAEEEEA